MVDFSALMIRVISYLRMQLPSHNVRKPQSDEEEGRVGSWVGGFLGGGVAGGFLFVLVYMELFSGFYIVVSLFGHLAMHFLHAQYQLSFCSYFVLKNHQFCFSS